MSVDDSHSGRLSRREAISVLGAGVGLGLVVALGEGDGLAAGWQTAGAGTRKVAFPKGAIIRTILKDVSPEVLGKGATLFHEHLSLSRPFPFVPRPKEMPPPHYTENIDLMVDELKAAAKDGLTCVVSGGTRDLGQKPENVRTIAERVSAAGMHIVIAGALHTKPNYPPEVGTQTEDQIADEFYRDATAQRWGALGEVGTSMEMHSDERKVFRAVAKTHLRTGLPIFTHTPHEGCKKCALEQLDLLESMGVNPRIVCIGHLSDIRDDPRVETAIAIAKRGAFLGFDTVGVPVGAPDSRKVGMIMAVLEAGHEDHLLLSSDYAVENLLKSNTGSGYSTVLTVFLPKLRYAGVKEPTLHKIMVDNPRRFLAFVPKRSS